MSGVQQVGIAFDGLTNNTSSAEDAFNQVMLEQSGTEILLIRVSTASSILQFSYTYRMGNQAGTNAQLTYTNAAQGNCITSQEFVQGNVRMPAAVICNGQLKDAYAGTTLTGEASQYTIVHELGHLFDYVTQNRLTNYYGDAGFILRDCQRATVMGASATGWARGRRGWGTGPATYLNTSQTPVPLITRFQQNPSNIPLEAVADMFLNWVYRVNSSNGTPAIDSCNQTPTPTPIPAGTLAAPFHNHEWFASANSFVTNELGLPGTPDASLPGDTRYWDFDTQIRTIFSANDW